MKKIFSKLVILSLIIMMASPVMAENNYVNSNFNDYSDQMQGGLQIYVENPAFSFDDVTADSDSFDLDKTCGSDFALAIDSLETYDHATNIAASADIVAGQVSFQKQDNSAYGYTNVQHYTDSYYDYYYGYNDMDDDTANIESTYTREGQRQEWLSTQVISTGFGQVQMQQHGIQAGSNVTMKVTGNVASVRPAMSEQCCY